MRPNETVFQYLVAIRELANRGTYRQNCETEIHTDASIDGLAAVLLQRFPDDNSLHPIYYMSRKTSETEKKYTTYELEVLAIIEAQDYDYTILHRSGSQIAHIDALSRIQVLTNQCTDSIVHRIKESQELDPHILSIKALLQNGLPRANGQVERINRTIIRVLSKMLEDDPTKWFKHVPSLQ
ncbi:retrovirus-related Pol polyprotein from transposon 297 [Trichonephila clavipes]|nr:retrovirus-related Pol polyprotein from transposon 297 [Trichonephila clavipes]